MVPACRVKREAGANPARCSHCEREQTCKPLGNREGQACDEQSQETCHSVESQERCPRLVLPTFSVPLWG